MKATLMNMLVLTLLMLCLAFTDGSSLSEILMGSVEKLETQHKTATVTYLKSFPRRRESRKINGLLDARFHGHDESEPFQSIKEDFFNSPMVWRWWESKNRLKRTGAPRTYRSTGSLSSNTYCSAGRLNGRYQRIDS